MPNGGEHKTGRTFELIMGLEEEMVHFRRYLKLADH
jgi:hypothetical protein